ncbi:hypothetical protein BH11ARM2_BH11ARM2_14180 [soil metagenome]
MRGRLRSVVDAARILLDEPPYAALDAGADWNRRGRWPAEWIAVQGEAPRVAAYRLALTLDAPETRRVHIAADEDYELFLNGVRIGRGSERGEIQAWPFDTYDLALNAGENRLVARVWTFGAGAAFARWGLGHAFLLSPDDPALADAMATGRADWKAKIITGVRFESPQQAWGTGMNVEIDGTAFPWGHENGEGEWETVPSRGVACAPSGRNDAPPQRLLSPATLPSTEGARWTRARIRHVAEAPEGPTHAVPIRSSDGLPQEGWEALLQGDPLTVPARARRRVLIDLDDYVCAFPELTLSGGHGASVRVHWQESLFDSESSIAKGDRDATEGKFFSTIWEWQDGIGDTFLTDGGSKRFFTTPKWQCGRYVELLVETGDEPLTIDALAFREDRYPLENAAPFEASDPRLARIGAIGMRTLQMCAHDTYMDCPYFERLQYAGDTRLQALVTYVTSEDDRLPRQALRAFDRSRLVEGITLSRAPSRVAQVIPPFSLLWVGMVHDFALWRGDRAFVASLMPGVRAVLDWFLARRVDGLFQAPGAWNYVDWVPAWHGGMPPGASQGPNSSINRQFEIALRQSAELEEWLAEPELAQRCRRNAETVSGAIHRAFWDEARGLYADDRARTSFSEHAQTLAILAGDAPASVGQGLLEAQDLHRATIYFSHYLFEAYGKLGRTDRLRERLDLWFGLLDQGLRTTVEMPEPTRSDCHAWGAHPLYHFAATLLGIHPEGFGGKRFRIVPNLGGLDWASGGVATPSGPLLVSFRDGRTTLDIPPGVTALFEDRELGPGHHRLP